MPGLSSARPAATRPGRRALLLALFGAVAVLRVVLALRAPVETTDVLRNLGYGRAFWTYGFHVYDLQPFQIADGAEWGARLWPAHTFNYPVVTLFFFAALARISSSLIVAKLVLGALEGVNALLVARVTGSPWLALAYFASPASLYWVSSEGQFEPLVAALMLLALDALRERKELLGWLWLGLAIQAKLFPVVLIPHFAARARSMRGAIVLLASSLPSVLAMLHGTYILRLFVPGYWPHDFNPFWWDFRAAWRWAWMPAWLVEWSAAYSYGMLALGAALLAVAWWRRGVLAALSHLPYVVYVAVLKTLAWGQFWYAQLCPALACAVDAPGPRAVLLVVSLLEVRGTTALVLGPIGFPQWFPLDPYLLGGT